MWNSQLTSMKNNVHKIVNNLDKILVLNIARVDDYIWLANEILKSKPLSDNDKKMVTNILNGLMLLLDHKKIGGIVAKWMPRKHGKYSEVVKFMRKNGVINTYSDYRRVISHNSHTVEQQMSKNDWSNINLEKVPSIAMKKYKKAFLKRNLLLQFVKNVAEGSAKINAKKLTPGTGNGKLTWCALLS